MAGLEFSVPFNNDEQTFAHLLRMREHGGNRIREMYLSAPSQIAGSGRVGTRMGMEQFERIADVLHQAQVGVDITMNSTCEGANWYSGESVGKTVGFVRRMHEEHHVGAVTLANPFLVEAVRKECPDIEISASVLADIDCYDRARVFADAGATTFTPDTAINRDVKLLESIHRDLGLEVKLMVNEGCLYKCPYRKFHMNYISHRSVEQDLESQDFSFACGDLVHKDPARIFRSNWVRPEELSLYAKATRFFKIVGRDMLRSKVTRCVRAYMEESYDGNLLDLLCSSTGFYGVETGAYIDNKALGKTGFFKRLSGCNRKCHQCTYCDELVRTHLRYGRVTEENLLDMGQYRMVQAIRSANGGAFPRSDEYSTSPLTA